MASTTPLSNFYQGCTSILEREVLPDIVTYLASKDVTVTVEELLTALSIEKVSRPSTPSMIASVAGVTTKAGPKPKAAAIKTVPANTATFQPGITCSYKYQHGARQGTYCGKSVIAGSDYCSACTRTINSREKKKSSKEPQTLPGVSPFAGGTGGQTLQAHMYDASNSLTIEPVTRFLHYSPLGKAIGVVGKDLLFQKDDPARDPQPLDEVDLETIKQKGWKSLGEDLFPAARLAAIATESRVPTVPSPTLQKVDTSSKGPVPPVPLVPAPGGFLRPPPASSLRK